MSDMGEFFTGFGSERVHRDIVDHMLPYADIARMIQNPYEALAVEHTAKLSVARQRPDLLAAISDDLAPLRVASQAFDYAKQLSADLDEVYRPGMEDL